MRAIAILIPMLIMGCGKKVPDHQAQKPVTPKPKTPKVEPPALLNGGRGFEGDLRRVDTVHEGDVAPDFKLKTLDGKRTMRLRAHRGKQPVVLVFGSYT